MGFMLMAVLYPEPDLSYWESFGLVQQSWLYHRSEMEILSNTSN